MADLINRHTYGGSAIRVMIFIPYIASVVAVCTVWQVMLQPSYGPINEFLRTIGIENPPKWLVDEHWALIAIVLINIWSQVGYYVAVYMSGLKNVPADLYEAAQIDGAGERTILFRITLPMIRPVIFTIVILSFLNSFKVFREAYLVAGNYPQENIYLLQHLFNNWFMDLSVDKMAAGAGILVVVAGALTMLLQRSWEKSYDSKFAG